MDMMEVEPLRNCFICRQIFSKGTSFEELDEGCAFEFFCQVFNLPKLEATFGKFENSEICGHCGRKMRDAMLIWTQLKFLEEQMEEIKGDIQKSITKSYKCWDTAKQENRGKTSESLGRALSQCWGDCRVVVPRIFQKSERQVTAVSAVQQRRNVKRQAKRTDSGKHKSPKSELELAVSAITDGYSEQGGDIQSENFENDSDFLPDADDAKSDTEEESSAVARANDPSKKNKSDQCFKCKICDSTFEKRHLFRRHCTDEHGVNPRFMCRRCGYIICSSRVEAGQTWFVCEVNACGRKFKALRYLREHHQRRDCSDDPKAIERRKKKFPCDQCDKVYYAPHHLRYHVSKVHEKSIRFCCEICGAGYMYQCLLDRHLQFAHTNEKPHGCDECGLRFKRPSQLFIHKRRHTGEAPFVCEQCGKTFIRAEHLVLHRKNIHSTDVFHCPVCGKHFRSKHYVRNHVRSFHDRNPGYRSKFKPAPKTKRTANTDDVQDTSEHSDVEFLPEISNDVPEPALESIVVVTTSA